MTLTKLAVASKQSWGYGPELVQLWLPGVTFAPENIRSRIVIVVEDQGGVVAVSSLDPYSDEPEIDGLWVDSSRLQLGVGRRLLCHTLELASAMGIGQVKIVSDPHAAGFYTRMGANQVGWQNSTPAGRKLPVFHLSTECQGITKK